MPPGPWGVMETSVIPPGLPVGCGDLVCMVSSGPEPLEVGPSLTLVSLAP